MKLVDRYLQAVRTYLPKSQQDDIVKELSENLRSQIEDQESGLGRPLNEEEVAGILKKHGHPLVVATRYRQSRYLIGPTLFPVYWFAVKIILAIVAFGYAVGALVMIAQGQSIVAILGAVFGFVGAVLPAFGWITVIFAVLDLTDARFHLLEKFTKEANEKFDPRSLPAARPLPQSVEAKPIPRSKTTFELFFTLAFLLWWIRVNPIRKLAMIIALGPIGLANNLPFALAPVWRAIYVPVIVLTVLGIAQQIITLIYPERLVFYSIARFLTNAGNLAVAYVLARASELLVMAPHVQDATQLVQPLNIVNQVLHYVMFFVMILSGIECLNLLRRLMRLLQGPAVSPAL
jgi:hypothetical protein